MEQAISLGLTQGNKPNVPPIATALANQSPPVLTGTPEVGQSLTAQPGTWVGTGPISFAYQWMRDAIPVPGETGASYLLSGVDDQATLLCRVTAADSQSNLSADTSSVVATEAVPTFISQPTISPLNAETGSVFTLTLGAVAANATLAIDEFTLNGVDISGQLAGLTWDSTGSAPGDLLYSVSATNSGGNTVSNIIGAIVQAAPAVPDSFSTGAWTLSDAASGGTLTLNFLSVPADGGSALTDFEYQIDGGAWVSAGLSVPGTVQITGLVDDQAYSVAVRALNGVGAGLGSAPKVQTPTGMVATQGAARFGAGNAPGTGAFDTGGQATDGVFGDFASSGGVITPNASLTPGNYTVGGFPVEVSAGWQAVATQAEFNALTSADEGKTIIIRPGARIVWNQNNASAFGRRRDMSGTTILGDGPDPRLDYATTASDAQAHFNFVKFRSCAGIVLENLRFTPIDASTAGSCLEFLEASSGGTMQDDVTLRKCVFKTSNPGAYTDYSGGSFPGKHGILCQANIPIGSVSIHDCVFYGNRRSIELPAIGTRSVEIVGNRIDMNYEDFIKINAALNETPVLLAGNYCTRGLSQSSDAGNPHTDVLQYQGASDREANLVLEGNFFFTGDSRGDDNISGVWYIFGGSGLGVSGLMRACGNIDGSVRSMNVGKSDGFKTEYCATIPNDRHPVPYGSAQASHLYDGGVANTGSELAHSFFGDYLDTNYNGNIAVQDCRKIKTMSAAALTSALPAYPIVRTAGPYVMSELIDLFQTTPGGVLATKGPAQIISLAPGAEQSAYTLDPTLVPTPVLSGLNVTPSTGSFTASVQTNVDLNPIYWVVTAQGATVTDPESIKKRRIQNALDHGYSKVPINQVNTAIGLTGTASQLQSGTGYTLHVFQENGWTRNSAILTANFTTP